MNTMELRFSASLLNESFARTAVTAFIASLNPSMDELSEIKTIVSEAVSNAIIHGYRLDASKEVVIKASLEKDALVMIISDYGVGIENIEQALKPNYTTRPDLERAGMGLTIIQSLSDEFSIRSVIGMGTKITIRKCFSSSLHYAYDTANSGL